MKGSKKNEKDFQEKKHSNETYVPMLFWSSNFTENNLRIWKEQMQIYAMRNFGHLGLLFEDNKYYEPPEIEIPEMEDGSDPFNEDNDPHGLLLEDYKMQLKERRSAIAKMELNKIPLYAFMMTKLSAQSKTALMREPTWEEIDANKDALALWLLIQTTHLGGNGGTGGTRVIPGETERMLYKNLENTKLGESEQLSTYMRRFMCALECYDGAEIDQPSDPIKVALFIENLNDHRFKAFKSKLKNDFHQSGIAFPDSINEAFRKASDWEIDNPAKSVSLTTQRTSVSYHGFSRGGKGGRHGPSRGRSRDKKSPPTCFFCDKQGHFVKDCELYKAAKSSLKTSETEVTIASRHVAISLSVKVNQDILNDADQAMPVGALELNQPTGPDDVLLDSQSQDHIFQNEKLLHDIKTDTETMTVFGQVADSTFSTNQVGKFLCIKRKVYFSSEASANLLSLSKLEQEGKVEYERGFFLVTLIDGTRMTFRNVNDLFICNVNTDIDYHQSTHQSNIGSYVTRRESIFDSAELLIRKLGYPSDQAVVKALQNGSINNSPCTSTDIYAMRRARGASIPVLKGKSRMKKMILPRLETFQPLIYKVQTLFIDVMACEGILFLISVSRPLDLLISTKIESVKSKDIKVALKNQVNLLKAKNFDINEIHSDGGFRPLHDFIASFNINHVICAAGAHVSIAERKIRVIKERMRTILFSLPYLLPNSLLSYLVSFVTRTVNMVATKNSENNLAPFENFMGRKINYDVDLRIYFGMYCQVLNADTNNSMESRTTGAIALTQTNSNQGTGVFYDLNTKKIIHRNKWTSLPIPQDVIDRMNEIATAEKRPPTKNPAILIGSDQRVVNEISQEEIPSVLPPIQRVQMQPNTINIEIDHNRSDPNDDDDDDDSDYVPSEQDDEEFEADFEETLDDLKEQAQDENVPHPIEQSSSPDNPIEQPRYPVRSNRGRKAEMYGYHVKSKNFLNSFGKKGEQAINNEINNMMKKNVFHPVKYEELSNEDKRNILPSFIFLKQKYTPNGNPDKVKARLVAGGNHQDRALYNNVSSPTADINHIFIEATLAAARRDSVATMDIGAAYLNADMEDRIFMILDKNLTNQFIKMFPEYQDYVTTDGKIIVQLKKALYGCIQSAWLWYKCIRDKLLQLGFTMNQYDQCIFTKSSQEEHCVVIVYVDDLMLFSSDKKIIDQIEDHLKSKFGEVNVNHGNLHSYLGMEFKFEDGAVKISMKGYIDKLILENNINEGVPTPASEDLLQITNESLLNAQDSKSLHSLVAQLLYLSVRVRPDIMLPVNFLSTRVNKFTANDQNKALRVLKYLFFTRELGLILKCENPQNINLVVAADASYGIHADGKSQTGMVTSIGTGSVYSSSSKQKVVTKSSSESELIAASDAVSHLLRIKNYLQSRNFNVQSSKLLQDNLSTQSIIKNGVRSAKRMRHLNIRYFFIKQYVDQNEVIVDYISTKDMVADLFTKPLQGAHFNRLRDKILGCLPMSEEE